MNAASLPPSPAVSAATSKTGGKAGGSANTVGDGDSAGAGSFSTALDDFLKGGGKDAEVSVEAPSGLASQETGSVDVAAGLALGVLSAQQGGLAASLTAAAGDVSTQFAASGTVQPSAEAVLALEGLSDAAAASTLGAATGSQDAALPTLPASASLGPSLGPSLGLSGPVGSALAVGAAGGVAAGPVSGPVSAAVAAGPVGAASALVAPAGGHPTAPSSAPSSALGAGSNSAAALPVSAGPPRGLVTSLVPTVTEAGSGPALGDDASAMVPASVVSGPTGRSDAVSGASAPAGPVLREVPVSSQVARQVSVLRTAPDGAYTLTIQVTPEELGPVNVQVTVSNGEVDLTLRGAHDASRAALAQAVPELRRELEGAGLTCNRVEVDADPDQSAWFSSQPDAEGHQSEHGTPDRRARSWMSSGNNVDSTPAVSEDRSTSSGVDVRM